MGPGRRLRRGLLLVLLVLAAGLLAPGAGAAPPPAGRQNLKAKQDALGEVRRQLDEARERASAARQRETSLLAELERIDRTLVAKRGALQQLDRRIVQVEGELDALEGRRDRVAEDLVSQQAALSARLETLAWLAAAPAPPAWAAGAAAFARRRAVADLAGIARDDLIRLTRYDETADRLAVRQEAKERARRELVDLRSAVDGERAQVATQAERRRTLLQEVREDRAGHERLAEELTEAARRLEALVRSLARRSPAARGGPGHPRAGSRACGWLREGPGAAPLADGRSRRDWVRPRDPSALRDRDRANRHRHRGAGRDADPGGGRRHRGVSRLVEGLW